MADDTLPSSRPAAKAAGAARYYTGKPCKHGHIAERRTDSGSCEACVRIRSVKPEAAERVRLWRAAQDPAWLRAWDANRARKLRAKNPAKARAADKANRALLDPAKRAAVMKSWRQRRAEHVTAYDNQQKQAWRDANPEKARAKGRAAAMRRRVRLLEAEGSHTAEDVAALLSAQAGRCAGCGKDISNAYEVDHLMPLSRGGSNWPGNLQPLCRSCNARKHNRTMEEWRAAIL